MFQVMENCNKYAYKLMSEAFNCRCLFGGPFIAIVVSLMWYKVW